jgi:hypothetical protein
MILHSFLKDFSFHKFSAAAILLASSANSLAQGEEPVQIPNTLLGTYSTTFINGAEGIGIPDGTPFTVVLRPDNSLCLDSALFADPVTREDTDIAIWKVESAGAELALSSLSDGFSQIDATDSGGATLFGQLVGERISGATDCEGAQSLAEAAPDIGALGNFDAVGFLRSDGTTWTWGDNFKGELGDDTGIDSEVPVEALISDVVDISDCSGGGCPNAAVKSDGTAWVWGTGAGVLIGDNAQPNYFAPEQVPGITDAIAVSTGQMRAMAILQDLSVVAWGGVSGWDRGLSGSVVYPATEVPELAGAIDIVLGRSFGVALRSDGTVLTWGNNESGVLGRSVTQSGNNPPGMVEGLSEIVQIAAGDSHVLALGADGRVWGWGRNAEGQVGDGTKAARSEPREVTSLSNVSFIQTAFHSSFAILADGTVFGWGNWANICCDPPYYEQPDPYEVTGIPPMVIVGALSVPETGSGSIGLSADGELWLIGAEPEQLFGEFDTGRIPAESIPSICQSYFFSNGNLNMKCVDTSAAGLEPPVYEIILNPLADLDFSVAGAEPIELPDITPLRDCATTYTVEEGLVSPCLTAFLPGFGTHAPYRVGFEILPTATPTLRATEAESARYLADSGSPFAGSVVGDDPLEITGSWEFVLTNINLPLRDQCANHPVTETENVVISYNPNTDMYRFLGDGANFDGEDIVTYFESGFVAYQGDVPYDNGARLFYFQAAAIGGQLLNGAAQWNYAQEGVSLCQGNWQVAMTRLD